MPLIAGGGRAPARSTLTPTPQQEALYAALRDSDDHVCVEARAGTGKSTSCAEGMFHLPPRADIAYCAFNKHIATEFAAKAPANCRAATMHSFGYRVLRDALGDVAIDANKTETLAEKYFPDRYADRGNRSAVAKLVGLCKNLLIEDGDDDKFHELAVAFDLALGPAREEVLGVAREVLADSRRRVESIDFDDMIWLPVVLELRASRPADVLFVDEAQDTNACQAALVDVLCPEGRIAIVGDPHQAIYAFRGAHSDAIANLARGRKARGERVATLPLTVTWRCPRSHVELANAIVPDLESAPGAAEGEVLELEEAEALATVVPGDMVLCRTNAPLVAACYRLLRDGRRGVVRGRDIGKGLLALIARLRAAAVPDLIARLKDHRVRETRALSELRNPGAALLALKDRVDCVLALCEGCATVEDVKARIERLFSDEDERGAVVFSSIHRAKGLERDSITILQPHLLPHPSAKSPVEASQERNLCYVGLTRSRHRLVFAGEIPAMVREGSDQ